LKVSKSPVCLILHGHFYQPPRENPWTDQIERQDSALPDHDWNERIAQQCYIPNTCSRVLDPQGKIVGINNNYEYLSFNFGPTLLSWLEKAHPLHYQKIIEADKISCQKYQGHGNAIAQVYNHIIMPLADRRDKLTQIRWGKADFYHRFGRVAEGMWLAETAMNMETVECLIEEGIKFVILAPSQALRIHAPETKRKSGEKEEWTDVSFSNINTMQAYRLYPKDAQGNKLSEKYLTAFFYHGPLAHGISFAHFLRDANSLADRILEYAGPEQEGPRLVHAATDGEIYGHHEPFGDMCLAFLYTRLAREKNIELVNYGSFIERFPPGAEVEIKDAQGEGTSWSCVHGVGRWIRNCGCSTGGKEVWNQN
jgi:alpha-amylase/alpha-mannosidase (GH57 family)